MLRRAFGGFIVLLCTASAFARDVYVVRADARGPFINAVEYVTWKTDVFFHNPSETAATITLVGISNGALPDSRVPRTFTIPAQRSMTLINSPDAGLWVPAGVPDQSLWVLRLDVPETVGAEDVMFIGRGATLAGPVDSEQQYSLGKLRLPEFTALVAANQPQTHAATFLGSPRYIPSRTNVAIYNGGSVDATARIEFRDYCSDAMVSSATVMVPANTIVQPSFTTPAVQCATNRPSWAVYTVVTVDQPSFSFVSNLSNIDTPLTSISIAY
jgi:hypothetical protein